MRSELEVLAVFAGRTGGMIVTLVFLPIYHRLLGDATFGAVSVVLSFQALFLVFDLGLATVVGRDLSAAGSEPQRLADARATLDRTQLIVAAFALVGAIIASATSALAGGGAIDGLLSAGIIALAVLLNIMHFSLNARERYVEGNILLVAGNLSRAVLTAGALWSVSPTLTGFLVAQFLAAGLHLAVARKLLIRDLPRSSGRILNVAALMALWTRIRPMLIYTLAGAAAMNLDKPVISAFVSLETAGRYFLATTYVLTPVAALAGPLHSYFFAKVVAARTCEAAIEQMLLFSRLMVCALVAPVFSLVAFADTWLDLWLLHADHTADIAAWVTMLLPAAALGAAGYVPAVFLIGRDRMRFLAALSGSATFLLLLAVTVASMRQSINVIVAAYVTYHVATAVFLWHGCAALLGADRVARLLIDGLIVPLALLGTGATILWCLSMQFASPLVQALAFSSSGAIGSLLIATMFWRRRALLPNPQAEPR